MAWRSFINRIRPTLTRSAVSRSRWCWDMGDLQGEKLLATYKYHEMVVCSKQETSKHERSRQEEEGPTRKEERGKREEKQSAQGTKTRCSSTWRATASSPCTLKWMSSTPPRPAARRVSASVESVMVV